MGNPLNSDKNPESLRLKALESEKMLPWHTRPRCDLVASAAAVSGQLAVELTLEVGHDDLLDIQEDITLKETLAGCVSLDGVALDVRPDVVDSVEKGGGRKGSSASARVNDVVV